IGDDFRRLYVRGRDRIVLAAKRKILDLDDGKRANLRVARDVLWNGAFSDEEICAEYFGGILAASRSPSGDDDSTVPFVDVVKSMSSAQLKLHYSLYHSLATGLMERGENKDVYELPQTEEIFIRNSNLAGRSDVDLESLLRLGLISSFSTSRARIGENRVLPYCAARPSRFGILLYAAAHNQLEWWQAFGLKDLGRFEGIEAPELFGFSLDELTERATVLFGLGNQRE
ncbi:MAG: hypothetical protein OXK79_10115, partial [Chloroflexota bacterium]|nr:hypothetical protein [Chloroflexota bacterium]